LHRFSQIFLKKSRISFANSNVVKVDQILLIYLKKSHELQELSRIAKKNNLKKSLPQIAQIFTDFFKKVKN
jgi:hypothetical protein